MKDFIHYLLFDNEIVQVCIIVVLFSCLVWFVVVGLPKIFAIMTTTPNSNTLTPTTKQKAKEIAQDAVKRGFAGTESFCSAMEMGQWKDRQLPYILKVFADYMIERGMTEPDAQFDIQHQVDTFINDILPQKL